LDAPTGPEEARGASKLSGELNWLALIYGTPGHSPTPRARRALRKWSSAWSTAYLWF